jgi:prepilin-type N-terminal cleavage/methylation domain-containing protein
MTIRVRHPAIAGHTDRQASSGFTLVELSVVLVVSSLLMVAYLDASRLWLEVRRHDATMEHISLIHDAITHYYARNGAYPCPAAPLGSHAEDIKYDCTVLDAAAMQQAERHGIVFINSKIGRKTIEGAVPYRQLSIPRESTSDGWGNQFTYAVTAGLTSHDTFNANDGGIDIVDENATSLIDPPASALWALVSHGRDGSGSVYDGAATAQSCRSGRRDTLNCRREIIPRRPDCEPSLRSRFWCAPSQGRQPPHGSV